MRVGLDNIIVKASVSICPAEFCNFAKRGYSPLCLSTACDGGQSSVLADNSFQFHDLIQCSQISIK